MSQKQKIENGTAIMSARDTNIGITPEQMSTIMAAISTQIGVYALMAKDVVDERFKNFEHSLLEKFSSNTANAEAFKDPDFQYLLGKAQTTYARSGDDEIKDILIDLIAERSNLNIRNRISLSLNSAIEKASVLTREEFASLTLCFIIKYTQNQNIISMSTFLSYFSTVVVPLLKDIPRAESSYQYLVSEGCASISLASNDAIDILRQHYSCILTKGLSPEEAVLRLPDKNKDTFVKHTNLLITSMFDSTKVQLHFQNEASFMKWAIENNWDENLRNIVWGMFNDTQMDSVEIINFYKKYLPKFEMFIDLWNNTPLRGLHLTTTGIAIAHSNLQRLINLSTPLSTWIK